MEMRQSSIWEPIRTSVTAPIWAVIVAALLVVASGTACSPEAPSTSKFGPVVSDPQALLAQDLNLDIRFGSSISPDQARQVSESLLLLKQRHLVSGGSSSAAFVRFFGTDSMDGVTAFVRERTHLLISNDHAAHHRSGLYADSRADRPGAVNLSALLWMTAERSGANFVVDGLAVQPSSARIGVVALDSDYSNLPPMKQLATLIHESRHSDCSGGIPAHKVRLLERNGGVAEAMRVMAGESCGHFHVECSAYDHDRGLSCDARLWEGQTIGYLFARAIAQRCSDCSADERWQASLFALDSASHVLAFPDYIRSQVQQAMQGPAFANPEPVFAMIDDFLASARDPR